MRRCDDNYMSSLQLVPTMRYMTNYYVDHVTSPPWHDRWPIFVIDD